MAPKTPQGTSKTPKAASAGGPIPLTGIPAPGNSLQRRSLMPASSSAAGASGAKAYMNMTAEQQALLAEAISAHSSGLIDQNRGRAESIGSDSGHSSSPYHHYQQSPVPTSFSPGNSYNSNNGNGTHSPVLASPLAYRSPQTRRTSTSRPGATPESSPYGLPSNVKAANAAYSAVPPLTTTSSLQQSYTSNTFSPTTETPLGLKSTRLSAGPGSNIAASAGTGAGASRLMKQPAFQRPPSASGSTSGAGTIRSLSQQSNVSNASNAGPSPGILGSPIQSQDHVQFPANLEGIELGDRVVVESMGFTGYLRFVGTTEFKSGVWAGIELDTPTGKNDGSVNGVVYFNCRPDCGIFIIAAKIVKSEMLLPFSPTPAGSAAGRPPSTQDDSHTTPPPSLNHAAQAAAARITAGSRASKYIGMTANQLKQRNVMPPPTNTRPIAQQQQPPSSANDQPTGSPTMARTAATGSSNPQTISPTPTARAGLGNRLSQPGSKTSLLSQGNRTSGGNLARTASTSSPPTSVNNINTSSRPRTSPTPGRLISSPRRLSSRASDHSDSGSNSAIQTANNLLDQATLVQMAESPQGTIAVQLQQLQLDYGVAVAENNMLKTEMNQTKTQLEMARLLEKRDLSYEERAFLSKSLGRGAIDERLGQELEDLHTMKTEWEKERAAKDQEIKGITDKMTKAWLDAARSQKERTALIAEKTELEERIKAMTENGGAGSGVLSEEQQASMDTLKADLQHAEDTIETLESKLQVLTDRALEDDDRWAAFEESTMATQAQYAEQLALLEQERDDLQARLEDIELVMKVTTEALQSKLEAALRDATHSEEQLHEVQARLEHETEIRRTKDSEAESKLKTLEAELHESQSLLAKSDKQAKLFEEKAKDYEASVAKREQEIADLKLELEDLADMVQSEEVDRMRKVWEHEKKRLEDAVADDITVITNLRGEIDTLELNETELLIKIEELEASVGKLKASNVELESEVSRLKDQSVSAQEQFDKERSELEAKVSESAKAIESQAAETKEKIDNLEAIALTVETWKEQCEAMQFEMIQKTAKAEDVGFELADAQAQREALASQMEAAKKELEEMARFQTELKTVTDEKASLLTKVSELEAALALSAATPAKSPAADDAPESEARRSELEEEVIELKRMVHDLTRENVKVGTENKTLMEEHNNLMEAHKHVESECLKLMDEVERLHAESLAAASMVVGDTGIHRDIKEEVELRESTELKSGTLDKEAPASQSQSVIRLEGLLKEKQALLDRLTQTHTSEIRELRQRYVDLDRSKSYEIGQLNKELTELESLIESKIFHEADLEEEVQRKQKQIDRLQYEISDLKSQLSHQVVNGSTNGNAYLSSSSSSRPLHQSTSSSSSINNSINSNSNSHRDYRATSSAASRATAAKSSGSNKELFCEICEIEGHDIIGCTAVFGANSSRNRGPASAPSFSSAPRPSQSDERPYCDNCDEYGLHYTEQCPNESLTY
ncbi:CAP-Gly domain-containing linker protein 4 [Dissophora globulifera]|nr:CAP-Gly domain-containing linker protein 4 [Dissophora globulifera]